jgi:hypothetical protein
LFGLISGFVPAIHLFQPRARLESFGLLCSIARGVAFASGRIAHAKRLFIGERKRFGAVTDPIAKAEGGQETETFTLPYRSVGHPQSLERDAVSSINKWARLLR